ncbi:WD40 domain containing protein [Asbolus verrucosus]|uniref:WD40 domain containing protein n=1 Tax=Asbolus verrucosus TaxID=1661398 RepID=A0A482W6I6_ASBVE|nr:WD40 domain containing protein [Asbolus verrucosus]
MDITELLLTSSRHTQQWSASLWDYSSGSIVHQYKNGGVIAPKSLTFIGMDYILTAEEDKPVTHVWPLNSQEPIKKFSTILPENATTLAVSPTSTYLAAGIDMKLYIWHISSGKLFSNQKKNFQPISCIQFSDDGAYLIVAGQDGMLIVYDFVSLVTFHDNYVHQSDVGQVEPVYTKHDHSLPITDVHVGKFGYKSRLVTVSSDHTCKLYVLHSGELLLSLVFDEPLTSVIFDGPCWNLFVGTSSGRIQQFYLKEPPRPLEHHVADGCVFQGHQKRVTCLDLNVTFTVLVSGSEDNLVYIWEIRSRQILKAIEHKGEITNVAFVMSHGNFFVQNFKPKHVLKNLDRDLNRCEVFVDSKIQDYDVELSDEEKGDSENNLGIENARLRSINRELYAAALQISRKYNDF